MVNPDPASGTGTLGSSLGSTGGLSEGEGSEIAVPGCPHTDPHNPEHSAGPGTPESGSGRGGAVRGAQGY